MERSSKRGKIPQQDWPSIIARYEAGETLSSIARTYDCSPPAISYIVSRTRARNAAAEALGAAALSEPQLVKGHPAETTGPEAPPAASSPEPAPPEIVPAAPAQAVDRPLGESRPSDGRPASDRASPGFDLGRDAIAPEKSAAAERHDRGPSDPRRPGGGNGFGGAAAQNDPRRTLHLSALQDNGGQHGPQLQPPRTDGNAPGAAERMPPRPPAREQGFDQPPRQPSGHYPPPGQREPARMLAEPPRGREGGTFIDRELRERVDGDIAAFLTAFDAALAGDTLESRAGLREATDRLLRAGARTRIELERLEARVPLTPRDRPSPMAAAWRQR